MPSKILMCGNDALAESAIRAGLEGYFGYPITPQNEVIEYMSRHMRRLGRAYVQAESELAAINMVYGAAATGARVMTSSSSPGVSLMQEGISYLAGAELPAVIVNMVRGGPGLGNIAPAQGDYYQSTRGGGHGDYRTPVLAPSTVQELVDLTPLSFELAERYRTPVLILGDGILAQMMEPVTLPQPVEPVRRKPDWALNGAADGRAQRIIRSMYLVNGVLEQQNEKLQSVYDTITANEIRAECFHTDDAQVIAVAYGTTARIVRSAVRQLRAAGIAAGMVRPITLWPYPAQIIRTLATNGTVRSVLTVEMSMGQMVDDVRLAVEGAVPVEFLGRAGGGIPTVAQVAAAMKDMVAQAQSAVRPTPKHVPSTSGSTL